MNRQQDVTRRVVIDLKKVEGEIPRNAAGDPNFQAVRAKEGTETLQDWIEGNEEDWDWWWKNASPLYEVLQVFTPDQVVALVNRALYQMEYSRTSHRERSQKLRDQEKPVKEAFKRLFPTISWANATEEQLKAAVAEVYKPKGEEE